jgi:hypothetical protein
MSLIHPIKRLQRLLGIREMLLGMQQVLPAPIETLLLIRLRSIAGLVHLRAEVLDLLAGVSDFVETESSAGAFEEVPPF